jgi:hypothetical protein
MLRVVTLLLLALVSFNLLAVETEVKFYRPFDGASPQQAPVIIRQEMTGECWQQSQKIKREDAWRCLSEGKVYDPCFVKQFSAQSEAVCPQSPWVGSSVKMRLNAPVDNSQNVALDMAQAYPWALELASGEKCQAIEGGHVYDNLPIRYQCDSQAVLIGHMQRCKTEWSILQKTAHGVVAVVIARAWF